MMHSNPLAGALAAALTLAFATSTTLAQVNPQGQAAHTDNEKDKPLVRTDALGDPLPPQAIARLGTLRLRGCRGIVVFSPDGKYIVTAGGEGGAQAVFWDRGSGRRVKALKLLATESIIRLVFSPDGKKLAGLGHVGFVNPVWDVDTGKVLFAFRGDEVAFPDKGKELVSTFPEGKGTKVRTFDASTGRQLTEWELPHTWDDGRSVLSPDGRFAAFTSDQGQVRMLVIFDLAKRAEVNRLRLDQSWQIGFSSDGLRLITSAQDGFSVWECSSGKMLLRWKGKLRNPPAFSPDGRRIVWFGADDNGVNLFWTADVEAGRPHSIRAMTSDWSSPAFSPDGKNVAILTDGNAVLLLDSRSGRDQSPVVAHDGQIWRVEYSSDGRYVMTRDSFRLLVWEAATGCLLRRLPDDLPPGEAMLPNTASQGRIVTAQLPDGILRLRELVTGKELRRLKGKDGYHVDAVGDVSAVSADSRYVAICGPTGIRIYDLETGAIRCQFPRDYPVWGMNFTEDGRILEVTMQDFQKGLLPRFFDAHTGREVETPAKVRSRKRRNGSWYVDNEEAKKHLRELKLLDANSRPAFAGADGFVTSVHESPDGRYLAVDERIGNPRIATHRRDAFFIRVWDMLTKRPVLALNAQHRLAGFSPDGRTFISKLFFTGTGTTIHLWEVATGRERLQLAGHLHGDVTIGFRPDGRVLVSGGADTQVFLWDLTGRAPDGVRHETQHPPERMRELWQALADDDAAAAYRVIWSLVDAPAQTVAWMREQLLPIAPVERRQLQRLLADLDSDEFAVRSKASEELERLGELAEPALRDALTAKPTLECRRRCEDLLAKLAVLSSRRLRAVRAIEALEHIGTAEARALLEKLSQGAPAARQTQEAKAALQRMQR